MRLVARPLLGLVTLVTLQVVFAAPKKLLARDTISAPVNEHHFGRSVITKGGWLAVGSDTSVYLYVRGLAPATAPAEHMDDLWTKQPVAKLSTGDAGFGSAVALEEIPGCTSEHGQCGITVVVGTGSPANKAFVFECPAYTPAMLSASPTPNAGCKIKTAIEEYTGFKHFGSVVALRNDTISIGSGRSGEGSIWIFQRTDSTPARWPETATKKYEAVPKGKYNNFGSTISVLPDSVVVGAEYELGPRPTPTEQVWVYQQGAGSVPNWPDQTATVLRPPTDAYSTKAFGSAVSTSSQSVMVNSVETIQDTLVVANPSPLDCAVYVYQPWSIALTKAAAEPLKPTITLDVDGSSPGTTSLGRCDPLGSAVVNSDDRVVLHQPFQGSSKVLVWAKTATTNVWTTQASFLLLVPAPTIGGISVAHHTVAVGAPGDNSVHLFATPAGIPRPYSCPATHTFVLCSEGGVSQGDSVDETANQIGGIGGDAYRVALMNDGSCSWGGLALAYLMLGWVFTGSILSKYWLVKMRAPDTNRVGCMRTVHSFAWHVGLSFNATSRLTCLRILVVELLDATITYYIWANLTWMDNHGLVWVTILALILIKFLTSLILVCYFCFLILPTPVPRSLVAAQEDGTAESEMDDAALSDESAKYVDQIQNFSDIALMLDCICNLPICVVNVLALCTLIQAGTLHVIASAFNFAVLGGAVYDMAIGYVREIRVEEVYARRAARSAFEDDEEVETQIVELEMVATADGEQGKSLL